MTSIINVLQAHKAAIMQEFEPATNCLPQCRTQGVHQTDTDVRTVII